MDTKIWVSTESWSLRWNFSHSPAGIRTHYLSITSLHSNHWTMPTPPHSFIVQKQRQCHEDHTFTFCSKTRCHYKLYSFHDEQASLNLVEGSYIHTLYLQQAEPEDPMTTLPFSHSKPARSTHTHTPTPQLYAPHNPPTHHSCMLHTSHPHTAVYAPHKPPTHHSCMLHTSHPHTAVYAPHKPPTHHSCMLHTTHPHTTAVCSTHPTHTTAVCSTQPTHTTAVCSTQPTHTPQLYAPHNPPTHHSCMLHTTHSCMLHTTHPHTTAVCSTQHTAACFTNNPPTQLRAPHNQPTRLHDNSLAHSCMLHTTNTQLHAPQNQHRRNKQCSKNGKIQVLYSSPFNLYRDCSLSKH